MQKDLDPGQIARELMDSHSQDPFVLMERALDRMRETECLDYYLKLEHGYKSPGVVKRAHKLQQAENAYRDGMAVAFLFHDQIAQQNGELPVVSAEATAGDLRRHFRMQLVAEANLPPEEARTVTGKQFMSSIFLQTSHPLLLCMAGIVSQSPLYATRIHSQQAFVSGLLEGDSLLRKRTPLDK